MSARHKLRNALRQRQKQQKPRYWIEKDIGAWLFADLMLLVLIMGLIFPPKPDPASLQMPLPNIIGLQDVDGFCRDLCSSG